MMPTLRCADNVPQVMTASGGRRWRCLRCLRLAEGAQIRPDNPLPAPKGLRLRICVKTLYC